MSVGEHEEVVADNLTLSAFVEASGEGVHGAELLK